MAISESDLIQSLSWRYATKKFDPTRKIAAATWKTLEQALVLSPSSYGLQPWRFVVVNDPAVRKRLQPVSWNQPQIVDASHLVVFARRTSMTADDVQRYIDDIAKKRGVPAAALDGYKGMMLGTINTPAFPAAEWAARQAYIALGVFLASAAALHIDACPMEGINTAQYDEILGLPAQGYSSVVVATAGYRAADDSYAGLAKVRFDHDLVVKHV
jgi:nitroreductase